jgi:Tfp pilus assembly PilM family ATPase
MEDLIKSQLQTQMGCHPDAIVVRSQHVRDCSRGQSAKSEVICFAVARDTVMRYIDLLKRCRLEVVGAHTEILAMVRAFDHINRRESDVNVTNLYVDIGWAGTRVAISHGRQPVFARYIPFGGRHFDQHIAMKLNCDVTSARAHRISLQAEDVKVQRKRAGEAAAQSTSLGILSRVMPGNGSGATRLTGKGAGTAEMEDRRHGETPEVLSQSVTPIEAPSTVVNVDMSELLDTITDELSMCLRYHAGMFPDRKIDRAIFLGGETRLMWLCQHVVKELRLAGQLGDPLARLRIPDKLSTPGLDTGVPRPDWAVVCGLCQAPTDL